MENKQEEETVATVEESESDTKTARDCFLKAAGSFYKGSADLRIDTTSDLSCNRTQYIILEQSGKLFRYTRTAITPVHAGDDTEQQSAS